MRPGGCFHVCPFEQIAEFAPETITLNELYCHLSVVLMRQNAQPLLAHAAGAR